MDHHLDRLLNAKPNAQSPENFLSSEPFLMIADWQTESLLRCPMGRW